MKLNGVYFKKGAVVITAIENECSDSPKFAEVMEIYLLANEVLLGVQFFEVIRWNNHFHLWEVKATNFLDVVTFQSLGSHQVLNSRPALHSMGIIKFITLNFAVSS